MKVIQVIYALFLFQKILLAQDILITGKVVDELGKPIQNSNIQFSKYGLSTLTDASGNFQLSGPAVGIRNQADNIDHASISTSGEIEISRLEKNPILINVYNLQGNRIGHWGSNKSMGNFRISIHSISNKNPSGVYIIKISNGEKDRWLTYFSAISRPSFTNPMDPSNFPIPAPLLKSAAIDSIGVSALGFIPKSVMVSSLKIDLGTILLLKEGQNGNVSISISKASPREVFGASKIEATLRSINLNPSIIDNSLATGQESIQLKIIGAGLDASIKKEGFRISRIGASLIVTAIDTTGAMYGLFDLAEQIQMRKSLSAISDKISNPRFPFRAIKYNLPWAPYRDNLGIHANDSLSKDLTMWQNFLDMMAQNRFNNLTLWSVHPFPFMIKATNFPKATPFSDAEMAKWKTFWTTLFKMAKDRGIETYIINWNICVSPSFKANYGEGATNFYGNATTSAQIEKYTKESITQVINEYPDLTGLGITAGEAMQGWDGIQQTDWIKKTVFAGINAANRKIKFIYRAALSGDHQPHRDAIDGSGLDTPENPIMVELKFNWSHGHSSTTLVKAHGGGTGSEYWTNPAPSHHKMAWMIRNEDFFRLRWGEPDFIRDHIKVNGQDYVGGYFIGSESYIPSKDFFHKPNHSHISWKYAFERQWLYYQEWGRILYDPTVSDAVFANSFNQKYSNIDGTQMVEAFKLATRTTQRIASFFDWTWDFSFYTEGLLGTTAKFITLQEVIDSKPLEPNFVSIKTYGDGTGSYGTKVTPIQLAAALEMDNQKAMQIVNGIVTGNETLKCEIEDVKAWSLLGLYFAKKLRAAIAINQNKKPEAIGYITEAQKYWNDLVTVTDAHIAPSYLPHIDGTFHWKNFQADVDAEITWVNAH